jgi:FkbM family methyltransferase
MRITSESLQNWLLRFRTYGLLNTVRLFYFLRKDGQFNITIDGRKFFIRGNSVDFTVLNSIYGKGEYDFDPGFTPEVIIDAGANIGASTLFFSKRYPGARIIAIEPEPSNFLLLKRNMEPYQNVTCMNGAVWGRNSNLSLVNPEGEKYAFQFDRMPDGSGNTKGFSIDTIMSDMDVDIADLLKMDIEGGEYSVFNEGNTEWLKRVRVLIIELHEFINPGITDLFQKTIGSIRHRQVIMGENLIIYNLELTL